MWSYCRESRDQNTEDEQQASTNYGDAISWSVWGVILYKIERKIEEDIGLVESLQTLLTTPVPSIVSSKKPKNSVLRFLLYWLSFSFPNQE